MCSRLFALFSISFSSFEGNYEGHLDYKITVGMASEIGFSAVDLTVGPKGHILTKYVKTDLPKGLSKNFGNKHKN